jgi:hypothetical protein
MACVADRVCQSVDSYVEDNKILSLALAGLAPWNLSKEVPAQSSKRKQDTGRTMLRGGNSRMRASRASKPKRRVESIRMGSPKRKAHQSRDVILQSTLLEFGRS